MVTQPTLYERLGKQEAIAAVVERFYERILADDDLEGFFEGVDVAALRRHQVQFLSAATGGPVEYPGKTLHAAHADLGITDADFDAVAAHLDATLREFEVEDELRTAVIETVASLRGEVVTA